MSQILDASGQSKQKNYSGNLPTIKFGPWIILGGKQKYPGKKSGPAEKSDLIKNTHEKYIPPTKTSPS